VEKSTVADCARREGRVIEIDGEADLEAVEGLEAGELVAVLDHHRALDADEALRAILLFDAGGLDQEDEGSGAAVHDRHLGGAHIDVGVVDAEAGEGRQQVLDRGDRRRR
jgi:hypothetical protein